MQVCNKWESVSSVAAKHNTYNFAMVRIGSVDFVGGEGERVCIRGLVCVL